MTPGRGRARRMGGVVAAALATLLLGCSAYAPPSDEHARAAQLPIAGGQPAPDDTAVVGVVDFAGGQCSGSLIAPNLVLTAQHCVAETLDQVEGGVACGTTRFAPADSAGALFVLTLPEFSVDPADYRAVSEIRVPPGEDEFCGRDLALLFLAEPIADDVTLPLPPRVDGELAVGEVYSAVGYGAQDDQGQGSGERRRRDGLVLDCVGAACDQESVADTEWVGDEGTCKGDSGGPALDALGRVLGAVSRGMSGCQSPIYGGVYAWRDWIMEAGIAAADAGGYPAPHWALGLSSDPSFAFPVGAPCQTDADCASQACVADATGSYCSRACADVGPCPEGFDCTESMCARIPAPASASGGEVAEGGGCTVIGRGAGGAGPGMLALLGLAVLGRRRARHPRRRRRR
jgi:hypothetical protein